MKISNTFLSVAFFSALMVNSCSKDNDAEPSKNKTNLEKLTAKTWQVGETYQNLMGTRTHYLRGGENTTGVDIGAMTFKFNADGTGTHTDISGDSFNTTWKFTTPDESTLRITVNGTVEYDWLLMNIEENRILTSSLYGNNGLIVAKYIPAP